jgi:glycosyltransferase involved in cell wall biosynthesis
MLREQGVDARFVLVGERDPANPAAIPEPVLLEWQSSGAVEWRGHREDMPHVFAESSIVCLPSYREGLPKVLLEAAASGRPLVGTDVPGVREIVRHNQNGLLVPPRDSPALAGALRQLIENRELRLSMGRRGREIVVDEFSIERVIAASMRLYEEALARA